MEFNLTRNNIPALAALIWCALAYAYRGILHRKWHMPMPQLLTTAFDGAQIISGFMLIASVFLREPLVNEPVMLCIAGLTAAAMGLKNTATWKK